MRATNAWLNEVIKILFPHNQLITKSLARQTKLGDLNEIN